jgi:agmatinase
MNFPDYFADAESDFDEADIIIFGVPYDKTASFRTGASKAPKEIRQASWNYETFNLKTGNDLKDVKFHDYGNLDVKSNKPEEMVKKVKDFTSNLLANNKFPIAIGGEHSLTVGAVQAFPKDIAVLSLDAHIDFRQQYENEKYNHACVTRRIADHIDVRNIAVIGIRSAEKEEYEAALNQNLFNITSYEIKKLGIKRSLDKTRKYLGDKNVYLSMDIDVLDLSYAPGTSTPEPYGLTPTEVIEYIESFSQKLIGFDIVEVCPPYDSGQTSLLAAKFVRHVIENVFSNKTELA